LIDIIIPSFFDNNLCWSVYLWIVTSRVKIIQLKVVDQFLTIFTTSWLLRCPLVKQHANIFKESMQVTSGMFHFIFVSFGIYVYYSGVHTYLYFLFRNKAMLLILPFLMLLFHQAVSLWPAVKS